MTWCLFREEIETAIGASTGHHTTFWLAEKSVSHLPPGCDASPETENVGTFRLWTYRASSDVLARLGPAPGPPPDDSQCDRAYSSRWLTLPRNEAYTDMDPGVISFLSADELQASYGRDTCKARAKNRTIRRWSLANVEPWQQPVRDTEP